MLRILLLLLALSGGMRAHAQTSTARKVRFDGFYVTPPNVDKDGDTSYYYIRFYKDGQAITVTSIGKPGDLKTWFNRNMKNPSIGRYTITGSSISFPSTNTFGTVFYTGRLTDDEYLDLHVKSQINGNERDTRYRFVRIKGLR